MVIWMGDDLFEIFLRFGIIVGLMIRRDIDIVLFFNDN